MGQEIQGEGSDAAGSVKDRCWDQREALPGEPRCVICARYGEYICDETDDDVCSLECKQTLLGRLAVSLKPVNRSPTVKLPMNDDCYYVRDDKGPQQNNFGGDQIRLLRKNLGINVKGESAPRPMLSFSSCNLSQRLEDNLEMAGYEIPTPVQMQAIPAAMIGLNLLVAADTGSGKTASFLIPVISRCSNNRFKCSTQQRKPLAVVLAPTRELCVQVEEQAKILSKGLPFKTALIVGGDAMASQVYRLQQGVELIVGTPGRLIDLLSKHDVELDEISILVLDEVDCMLQRGFRDQVMQIFQALSQPQVLMFSATISQEVEKIASLMARDLIFISVGMPSRPSVSVKQIVIWVDSKQKKQKLFDIMMSKQHFKPPVVVFVGSRLGADLLAEAIEVKTGLRAQSVHGEKSMKERRESLSLFLSGEIPVLVATGVLGRGVNLLGVRQVVIFDMPSSIKEYVHQIGRASRFGEEGSAIAFVNEDDKNLFRELVEILKASGAPVPRELANSPYLLSSCSGRKRRRKYGS
ncbi:hypothetical protein H6P81_017607 [Aristolochia fimbriata]|uniref:DEAD-box ATP-dependent RNA helicase 41 n=1 Tax=Aristolochia fimbriata TaxID=158543 RepID=A0AAV7E2Y4_ARIFI|nr:hypothetical protein H6P81_017607 [Aristolochia fimbriata]